MAVFNLGMGEITIILLLALIFLGPKKLPELASGLGKLIREIRKTTADVKNEIQLDEAIRKPFEELREAVTLHPDELKRRDKLRKELADIQRQAEEVVAAAEADLAASGADAPAGTEGSSEGERAPWSPEAGSGAAPDGDAPVVLTDGAAVSGGVDENSATVTPPPLAVAGVPAIPGAAPTGTVARTPSGSIAAPPSPPLAAVLAKAPPAAAAERRAAQPPSGSDFLRSLRAVPETNRPEGNRILGKRSVPAAPAPGPDSNSAADRSNVTQALSEADLAAITVGPPPPPRPPGPPAGRQLPKVPLPSSSSPPSSTSSSPRLPGATPPKNPNQQ